MSTPTQLRRDVENLTTLARRDLMALWEQVRTAAEAREALHDVLPVLIATYGSAAGAIATQWYEDARVKAGVAGAFLARTAAVPDPGVPGLVAWAAKEAVSIETMPDLVMGGVQKRVANVARATVIDSTVADRKAVGWMRVGAGACDFCRMLIGRGAVYTEATVNFGAHDNCNCQAAPLFPGAEPIDVEEYRRSIKRRSDSTRGADSARAREWIEKNLPEGPAIPRF